MTNKGDLISREALKEAIRKAKRGHYSAFSDFTLQSIYKVIDNAPTVDLSAKWAEAHSTGYDVGYTKGLEDARPQGEWIISQTMDCHSDIINIYTCPFCGKKEYAAYPFCHCGADMRGANNG